MSGVSNGLASPLCKPGKALHGSAFSVELPHPVAIAQARRAWPPLSSS